MTIIRMVVTTISLLGNVFVCIAIFWIFRFGAWHVSYVSAKRTGAKVDPPPIESQWLFWLFNVSNQVVMFGLEVSVALVSLCYHLGCAFTYGPVFGQGIVPQLRIALGQLRKVLGKIFSPVQTETVAQMMEYARDWHRRTSPEDFKGDEAMVQELRKRERAIVGRAEAVLKVLRGPAGRGNKAEKDIERNAAAQVQAVTAALAGTAVTWTPVEIGFSKSTQPPCGASSPRAATSFNSALSWQIRIRDLYTFATRLTKGGANPTVGARLVNKQGEVTSVTINFTPAMIAVCDFAGAHVPLTESNDFWSMVYGEEMKLKAERTPRSNTAAASSASATSTTASSALTEKNLTALAPGTPRGKPARDEDDKSSVHSGASLGAALSSLKVSAAADNMQQNTTGGNQRNKRGRRGGGGGGGGKRAATPAPPGPAGGHDESGKQCAKKDGVRNGLFDYSANLCWMATYLCNQFDVISWWQRNRSLVLKEDSFYGKLMNDAEWRWTAAVDELAARHHMMDQKGSPLDAYKMTADDVVGHLPDGTEMRIRDLGHYVDCRRMFQKCNHEIIAKAGFEAGKSLSQRDPSDHFVAYSLVGGDKWQHHDVESKTRTPPGPGHRSKMCYDLRVGSVECECADRDSVPAPAPASTTSASPPPASASTAPPTSTSTSPTSASAASTTPTSPSPATAPTRAPTSSRVSAIIGTPRHERFESPFAVAARLISLAINKLPCMHDMMSKGSDFSILLVPHFMMEEGAAFVRKLSGLETRPKLDIIEIFWALAPRELCDGIKFGDMISYNGWLQPGESRSPRERARDRVAAVVLWHSRGTARGGQDGCYSIMARDDEGMLRRDIDVGRDEVIDQEEADKMMAGQRFLVTIPPSVTFTARGGPRLPRRSVRSAKQLPPSQVYTLKWNLDALVRAETEEEEAETKSEMVQTTASSTPKGEAPASGGGGHCATNGGGASADSEASARGVGGEGKTGAASGALCWGRALATALGAWVKRAPSVYGRASLFHRMAVNQSYSQSEEAAIGFQQLIGKEGEQDASNVLNLALQNIEAGRDGFLEGSAGDEMYKLGHFVGCAPRASAPQDMTIYAALEFIQSEIGPHWRAWVPHGSFWRCADGSSNEKSLPTDCYVVYEARTRPGGARLHQPAEQPAATSCVTCSKARDEHQGKAPHATTCSTCQRTAYGSCGQPARGSAGIPWYCKTCAASLPSASETRARAMRQRRESAAFAAGYKALVDSEPILRAGLAKTESQERTTLYRSATTSRSTSPLCQTLPTAAPAPNVGMPLPRSKHTAAPAKSRPPSAASLSKKEIPDDNFVTAPVRSVASRAAQLGSKPIQHLEYQKQHFAGSQRQVPSLTPIATGNLIIDAKLKDAQDLLESSELASAALTREVRSQHRRHLLGLQQWLEQHPAMASLPLDQLCAYYMQEEGAARRWQWQTLHRSMCSLIGAMSNITLYSDILHPLYLNTVGPFWRAALGTAKQRAQTSQPRGQAAVTLDHVQVAVEEEPRLWARAALILMWLTSCRVGCCLQLRVGDVLLDPDGSLRVHFCAGKVFVLR